MSAYNYDDYYSVEFRQLVNEVLMDQLLAPPVAVRICGRCGIRITEDAHEFTVDGKPYCINCLGQLLRSQTLLGLRPGG